MLVLSRGRILGRIRPSWVQNPSHVKKYRPSLQSQVRKSLALLRDATKKNPKLQPLFTNAEELVSCLDPLNKKVDGDSLNTMLEKVIRKCADMAKAGNERSVRDHLKSLGLSLWSAPEMQQIDKLARYYFICRDLIRIARKPEYDGLFKNIKIKHLDAFPGITRQGIRNQCFVHAEIQQAIHYERHPIEPAPRVIGCSKSACYLCDLFIRKQNQYRVSHAHRRLYEKWTIPDVDWRTEGQAAVFRSIIQAMLQELRETIQDQRQTGSKQPWRPYPLESTAFLPLASGSTLSTATGGLDHQASRKKTSGFLRKSFAQFHIAEKELPFCQAVYAGQVLDVRIDQLSLLFDLVSLADGYLSIRRLVEPFRNKIIDVSDISTKEDMELKFSRESSEVGFCIQLKPGFPLQIDFHWSQRNGSQRNGRSIEIT